MRLHDSAVGFVLRAMSPRQHANTIVRLKVTRKGCLGISRIEVFTMLTRHRNAWDD